jgi:trehalose synthase
MRITDTSDLWWKNAVIYCLDAETFLDWNGDGCGDFAGLAQRVDYLAELGVTCIWLMPFYPTADVDDGYDITDFYNVDPRLGTLGSFVEFIRTARDRGLRMIADLVVNHTSADHPWFRAARSDKSSPYRDWYVWRDEPPEDGPQGITFPDKETSLWEYDKGTGQYYLHRFYRSQPDLNVANPAVRDEIARVMGFWMALGLSGFRIDAVPFLLETLDGDDLPDPHAYLRDLRAFLSRRSGEAVLLGEVNLEYEDTRRFFGDEDGDELTMCFDFIGMQALHLSMARHDASPLIRALRSRPEIAPDSHWATFVRNHDELTLDKLTASERQEVFDAFGPDPDMQLYGRGLRRRVPPMLGGDQARIRMLYSLLFSLPGTPVLFYGEEIGMGENLAVEGRLAVRTPMQWSDGPHAGFAPADVDELCRPLVEGEYGPEHVNVTRQLRDPDSLLSWVKNVIRRYRECPELSWGDYRVLDCAEPSVFAIRADSDGGTVLTAHNLAPEPVKMRLRLDDAGDEDRLVDLLYRGGADDTGIEMGSGGEIELSLDGYGYRWLRLKRPGDRTLC